MVAQVAEIVASHLISERLFFAVSSLPHSEVQFVAYHFAGRSLPRFYFPGYWVTILTHPATTKGEQGPRTLSFREVTDLPVPSRCHSHQHQSSLTGKATYWVGSPRLCRNRFVGILLLEGTTADLSLPSSRPRPYHALPCLLYAAFPRLLCPASRFLWARKSRSSGARRSTAPARSFETSSSTTPTSTVS